MSRGCSVDFQADDEPAQRDPVRAPALHRGRAIPARLRRETQGDPVFLPMGHLLFSTLDEFATVERSVAEIVMRSLLLLRLLLQEPRLSARGIGKPRIA